MSMLLWSVVLHLMLLYDVISDTRFTGTGQKCGKVGVIEIKFVEPRGTGGTYRGGSGRRRERRGGGDDDG